MITDAFRARRHFCSTLLGGHAKRGGDDNGWSKKGDKQIDGEQRNRRQFDQRRNRQNVPCPGCIILIGEDFRRDSEGAASHQ